MRTAAFFIGGVLPYFAIALFVGGMAYRLRVWLKTPQPAKMTLSPWPEGSMWKTLLGEVLLFPGLFRSDRFLWACAWVFHASLALVFLGHLRVVTGLIDGMLVGLGMSEGGIHTMSTVAGGAAGVFLLATALLLVLRRVGVQRAREISIGSDYFALLLLVAIIFTGDMMRFGAHVDLEATRAWAASLLVFRPRVPQNGAFLFHALLAQMLIAYIPFSKILHFGGVFFTQALVHRR